MSSFAPGTPAVDHYGTAGFIAEVKSAGRGMHVIGAKGLEPVSVEYVICWESGRVSTLSDGIAKPFVARALAANLPTVSDIAERRARIEEQERQARVDAQQERSKAADIAAAFYADAEHKTPSWAKAVIVAELIEDQSDSMSDYYGSTTRKTVILGFSKHTRDLFPELRKFAATFKETESLAGAPESAEHREKYSMGAGFYLKSGFRNSSGWKVKKYTLYNGFRSIPVGEWNTPAAAAPAAPISSAPAAAAPAVGFTIEEHTHTKKGFQMHIVILADRVEREEFFRLSDSAKTLGGWYSKQWGKTPGGFAFKERSAAESFACGLSAELETTAKPAAAAELETTAKPAAPAAKTSGAIALADKFRTMADKLQPDIDSKFSDRLANTPKRQREAAQARLDGWHLKRTQAALRVLADKHESATLPACLSALRTKAEILELMRSNIDRSNAGYYQAGIDTNTPAKDTEQARVLWSLIAGRSKEEEKAESLRSKIQALYFSNIPGYFPTPADIVSKMIEQAAIPDHACLVLEPSAGSGAICDGIRNAAPAAQIEAYERHSSLAEILTLKGYDLAGRDFTEAHPTPRYDRVLMNPPFENSQDIDHVRRAYGFLKAGGRLVAIMSPGPFFRQDRKAAEFREWFESLNGWKVDLPAGAFKESGTGVATVLVTIEA